MSKPPDEPTAKVTYTVPLAVLRADVTGQLAVVLAQYVTPPEEARVIAARFVDRVLPADLAENGDIEVTTALTADVGGVLFVLQRRLDNMTWDDRLQPGQKYTRTSAVAQLVRAAAQVFAAPGDESEMAAVMWEHAFTAVNEALDWMTAAAAGQQAVERADTDDWAPGPEDLVFRLRRRDPSAVNVLLMDELLAAYARLRELGDTATPPLHGLDGVLRGARAATSSFEHHVGEPGGSP